MKNGNLMERSFHLSICGHSLYTKLFIHASPESEETRPTLIFLHEALGSVAQWKGFPREVCSRLGCDGVVYDRAGHGQSSAKCRPPNMGLYKEEAECVLPVLLAELGIKRPFLIGHSDGATIALTFAARFPNRVVGVVSEAAHVFIEAVTLAGIEEARYRYENSDLPLKLARYHGDKTDDLFRAWAETWLQPSQRDWNMFRELENITCPLLIIQGENDVFGSRAQVDRIVEYASGPVTTLWLPDCGHVPHLEVRSIVVEAIAEFMVRM